jgi:hypothetical protein
LAENEHKRQPDHGTCRSISTSRVVRHRTFIES